MQPLLSATLIAIATAALVACGSGTDTVSSAPEPGSTGRATPRAACGPGSRPETGMQGRVTAEDVDSGRAAEGYTCNIELVGSYTTSNPLGTVAGFKVERYIDRTGRECAYYDTTTLFPTNLLEGVGVNVMDMSDPANPRLSTRLITPATASPA